MPKGYHHLTKEQRCQIYALKKRGDTVSCIAKELEVNKSTIWRELKKTQGTKDIGINKLMKKLEHVAKRAIKKCSR